MAERRVRSPLALLTRTLAAGALAGLVLLLDPGPLAAQGGIITGRVTDAEAGEGVTQVLVEVVAGAARPVRTATTDESGGFQVTGVPAGTYSLVFSRIAYETKRIDGVTVGEGVTAVGDVSLVSRAFRLNPIVVSASKREEKALEAPAAVSVIDRREIEERPATTAVDHVKDVKGADVVTTGLAQHNVVARGGNNVFSGALFVLTDNRWASVPSLRFNAYNMIPATNEDIERIEFVLGPGSALYGPNVDKGVMHIITRSPLETQETTLSLVGGEREVGQAAFRHSGLFSENVGYKFSGTYFRGRDWLFTEDVGEEEASAFAQACLTNPVATNPACTPFLPAPGQNPDTARLQRVGQRDFDAERFAGEVRLDFRLGEETGLVLSSGVSQLGSSIEMTGIGAAQARDWRYTYVQARLRHKELFAQSYINFSDAGETYLLRDGSLIEDNSFLYVGQVQHGLNVGERQRFIYGVDFIQTIPRTDSTINGINEEDDDITEVGGYVQSETRLSPQFDLVTAARLDYHSVVEDLVFSPRVAVVFRPQPGHNFRATYNRAFSQPTTNNLFLD
ncbi:MAG: TonB-dependent receptor, partial [Gemmatimonadota bacterium]